MEGVRKKVLKMATNELSFTKVSKRVSWSQDAIHFRREDEGLLSGFDILPVHNTH